MKAVLFDMDGILIDTEKYLTVYKQKAMREAGYRLDLETAYKFRSCASVFAREQMKGIFGENFPYDELRRRRQELMSDHIARFGIEKKPYVEETMCISMPVRRSGGSLKSAWRSKIHRTG